MNIIFTSSCELDNFTCRQLCWVVLFWYHYITAKEIYNTLTVRCEKSKMVSFDSSLMKQIVAFAARFSVILICYIASGSTANACSLLKSVAIIL